MLLSSFRVIPFLAALSAQECSRVPSLAAIILNMLQQVVIATEAALERREGTESNISITQAEFRNFPPPGYYQKQLKSTCWLLVVLGTAL
jgi:hypothetical protein